MAGHPITRKPLKYTPWAYCCHDSISDMTKKERGEGRDENIYANRALPTYKDGSSYFKTYISRL